jgi:hypothetical protein
MRSHTALRGFILRLILLSVCWSWPALCIEGQPAVMPVSQLRPGMTGHGLTCLTDGPPQTFQFDVLGVMKGAFPKGDVILIRMRGPIINEAGIIAGMSGSPVYIDGKLVGAVAYGFPYCRIPLGGVTPAEEMLQVREIGQSSGPAEQVLARAQALETRRRTVAELGKLLAAWPDDPESVLRIRQAIVQATVPAILKAGGRASVHGILPPAISSLLPEGAGPELRPLPVPVAVSGMGRDCAPLLSLLGEGGFMPVQGMAGDVTEARQDQPLEPGVPIGAVFIRGDMEVAGMGTLTWTDGERILAFGHSLLDAGEVDIPLAAGRVRAVVPSLNNSFRLTNCGPVVGRITQDRQSAILGELGRPAPMFPCRVHVRGTVNEDYAYQVAGYWKMAPFFAFMAVSASSERWEGSSTPYTMRARSRIKVSGLPEPLVLENTYSNYSVVPPGLELVEAPLTELLLNPFKEVHVEALDYDLEVKQGFETATIESVWADRTTARPGSEVTVFVRLRQYRGAEVTRKVQLRVPQTAKAGSQVQILVCDAATDRMTEEQLDPGFFAPESLEALAAALRRMEPNRNLVVRASFVQRGIRYGGQAMPGLPPSALSLLESNPSEGRVTPLVTDSRQSVETPWVLSGSQSLSITVEEPEPYSP